MHENEFGRVRPVVILTALGLEHDAVRTRLTGLRSVLDNGTQFEVGELPGVPTPVVLAVVGPGNLQTAGLAERARARFKPQAIIFVGVAGSLKADVRPGDVVVATRVYAYEGAKHSPDGVSIRPASWEAQHGLLQVAQHALSGPALARNAGGVQWIEDDVRVHFKPIAAGESVLNAMDSPLRRRLAEGFSDAVAIDMESAGLAATAALGGVAALSIRGISDRADGQKAAADAAGSQPRAAVHAAAAAVAVIAALPSEAAEADRGRLNTATSAPAPERGALQLNTATHGGTVQAVQGDG